MTIDHIASEFFRGPYKRLLAARRLRVLYDLHCINRFFPEVATGSSPQHVVLDSAGAKILDLESYTFIRKLPVYYRHTIAITELRLKFKSLGFSQREKREGPLQIDLFYPAQKLAVEVDMGTESKKALNRKLLQYTRLTTINWLLFVTFGSRQRLEKIVDFLRGKTVFRIVGVTWMDINDAWEFIRNHI